MSSSSVFNSTTVYSAGDVVLLAPIEETCITLVMLLIAAIFEFLLDAVGGTKNKYFRVMFQAMVRQVMLAGMLILALLFTQTVYDWPAAWVYMFKWSMMCLFLMVMLFALQVVVLQWLSRRSVDAWATFEATTMEAQGVALGGIEAQYRLSYYKFMDALQAHGYRATNGVRFCHYVAKMMRRNVFSIFEIRWVSWVCLATVAVLNGLRVEAFMKLSLINDENVTDDLSDWQRFLNYFSFVALVGFSASGLWIGVFLLLRRRLAAFLEGPEAPSSSNGRRISAASAKRALAPEERARPDSTAAIVSLEELDDPRSYLFRHSLDATLELIQLTLIVTQWYVAAFSLGFSYQCVFRMGIAYGIPTLIAGFLPFFVPLLLSTRLLFMITVLGSLGTNLDEYAVQYLIKAARVPESEWPEKMRKRLGTAVPLRTSRTETS